MNLLHRKSAPFAGGNPNEPRPRTGARPGPRRPGRTPPAATTLYETLESRRLLSATATLISENFDAGPGGFAAVDGTWAAAGGTYHVDAANTAPTTHLNTRAVNNTPVNG